MSAIDDDAIKAAREAYELARMNHGGFLYGERHVIRDFRRWGNQEIWWRRQVNDADYQACHDAMVRELENIAWRDAIDAALVVIEGNKPRAEEYHCSVCGAYGDCWQNCTYPGCPDGR